MPRITTEPNRSLASIAWNVSESTQAEVQKDSGKAERYFPIPTRNGQSVIAYAIRVFDVLYKRDIAMSLGCSQKALAQLAADRALRGIYFPQRKTLWRASELLTEILVERWLDCAWTGRPCYLSLVKLFGKKYGKYCQN
ncbi:hypothetical protein ES703_11739 [subsurface metagenome]